MNWTAILLFLAIVGLTLVITFFAARKTKTASDFYTADGGLTGFQNGLAIAGDYMSAASFLGIAGMIALAGFDGFFYSIGFLVAYLVVLYLVAEPLRNLGKYTMADMIAARFNKPRVRGVAAMNAIVISIFYMIAQLVGAGALIELLLGIPYTTSVIVVGILMTVYVVSLAFAVAASAKLPVILFTIYWRRFNTGGAVFGMVVGLFSSLFLVAISPNVWAPDGSAILIGEALFPLTNPGIVSIPLGFLAAIVGTYVTKSDEVAGNFERILVKANTGINAETEAAMTKKSS